ncbi:UvrD-helicase domain-containing protein [Mycoplasmoides gallisepticum]|nr:UvrD-helicase domain-containing protein [Mycoplasmoides gallisepticum]
MQDYLKSLNKQQYDVVTSDLIPIFVVAGAGTGKTKVLTSRIAYLIEHFKIPEYKILAITFTNKAAKEMQHRLEKLLDKEKTQVSFRTFHGFCAQVLREEVNNVDRLNDRFNILDEVDQAKLIEDLLKSQKYEYYYSQYTDFKKNKVMSIINDAKTYNLDVAEFLASDLNKLGEDHILTPNLVQPLSNFYHDYEKALKELNAIDFNDLLNIAYNLFLNDPIILKKWQNRYEAILVDEFQDANEIQYKIVKLLREKNNNFLFVGDPDQSIYGWRGANSEIGDSIRFDFNDLVVKYLTQNYRSKQSILNLANDAIKMNNSRYFKSLLSHDLTDLGPKPIWINFSNIEYQNRFVMDKIKELVASKQYTYGDFAILYRTNFSSVSLERLIKENRIPYEIFGGYKFFLRKEIKDLIGYLKLVDTNDDIAFDRIINTPRRMIGDTSIEIIKELANKKSITEFEALDYLDESNIKANVKKSAQNFKKMIEDLRANQDNWSVYQTINEIIKRINYYDYLNEPTKHDSVNEFIDFLNKYEREYENDFGTKLTINDFIQNLALEGDLDNNQPNHNKNALKLMTIHSAKGLEFKNVFVINMNENILPSSRSIAATNNKAKLAEERRIVYVAYTRAKHNLWLCSNQDYDARTKEPYQPSRFLYELSDLVLDKQDQAKTYFDKHNFLTDDDGWFDSKKSSSKLDAWNSTNEVEHNYFVGEIIYHQLYGEGIVREIDDLTIKVSFKDKKAGTKDLIKNHKLITYAK